MPHLPKYLEIDIPSVTRKEKGLKLVSTRDVKNIGMDARVRIRFSREVGRYHEFRLVGMSAAIEKGNGSTANVHLTGIRFSRVDPKEEKNTAKIDDFVEDENEKESTDEREADRGSKAEAQSSLKGSE